MNQQLSKFRILPEADGFKLSHESGVIPGTQICFLVFPTIQDAMEAAVSYCS